MPGAHSYLQYILTLTYKFTLNHGPGSMNSAKEKQLAGSQAARMQSLAQNNAGDRERGWLLTRSPRPSLLN